MTGLLSQFGTIDEVTYGTPVVVTRFYETSNPVVIAPETGRTESTAMRSGTRAPRSTMFTPYLKGAKASVEMPVPTKGWGWWLKHMLGTVSTGAITDSNYTHTGTIGSLTGDFFTAQTALPFSSGTLQPFTGEGGKIEQWELSVDVDGHLMFSCDMDFETVNTATAAATPSYPSGALVFGWDQAAITFAASSVELSNFAVTCTNPLNTERRFLRGSTLKKEPVEEGMRDIQWTAEGEFTNQTQYDRWVATTPAGTQAAIVATFTGPVAHAGATFPTVVITIPVARFDNAVPVASGAEMLKVQFSGIAMDDGTNSPITVAYKTNDATP